MICLAWVILKHSLVQFLIIVIILLILILIIIIIIFINIYYSIYDSIQNTDSRIIMINNYVIMHKSVIFLYFKQFLKLFYLTKPHKEQINIHFGENCTELNLRKLKSKYKYNKLYYLYDYFNKSSKDGCIYYITIIFPASYIDSILFYLY